LSSSKLTPPNFQGSRDFPVHLKKDAKTEIPDPIDIRTEFKFSNSLTNTPEEVDRPVKQEVVSPEKTKRKRSRNSASFFTTWEKYTAAENRDYCRLNNKIQSPEPKNVLVIDLDEYEKELDQQNAKSMQRAKLARFRKAQNLARKYKCKFCSRAYQLEGTFRRHVLTHFDCQAFTCQICKKPNRTQGDLRRHLLKHGETKCLKCTSGRIFASSVKLHEHLKSAHAKTSQSKAASKKYTCLICTQTMDKDNLFQIEEHLASHSRLENVNEELAKLVSTSSTFSSKK